MARLIVISGESGAPEQTVELATESVTVGREAGNDVVLAQEPKASRKHLQIVRTPAGFEVVDLESKNGTRVNGTDVKRRALRPGDVVEIGKTRLRFEDEAAAAAQKDDTSCLLEYAAGDQKGYQIRLDKPRTTFGRRDTNTVVLSDKMTSSHHCEIVRDLNGYTIRDLGSTNGTLVNGAPVTEAPLTHGARVRIGNSRFVFKDPAMAHIEVELAAIEEDDAGWGMMAELDLAKSKGGGAGGLLAALGLLAAVGAGAFWFASKGPTGTTSTVAESNLVTDGRFEAADVLLWSAEENSPATVERSGTGGKGVLVVAHDGRSEFLGVARYADDLEMPATQPFTVSASMRREGEGVAELAVLWTRRGRAPHATVVGAASAEGGATAIKGTVQKPGWAELGRLVVRVGPKTTARVDDVVVRPTSDGPVALPRFKAPDEVDVYARRDGLADFVRNTTVLFAGGAPWARMPGGRVVGGPGGIEVEDTPSGSGGFEVRGALLGARGVDAEKGVPFRVKWAPSADGAVATVSVDGAEAVAISADFPRAHLDTGIRSIDAATGRSYPAEDLPPVDGVVKVLAGDPRRRDEGEVRRPPTVVLFTLPAQGGRLEPRRPAESGYVRLALWQAGPSAEFPVLMAFGNLVQEANRRLSTALSSLESSTGPAIAELRRIAEEFALFEDVREKALQAAQKREQKAYDAARDLGLAIQKFRVYGSKDALEDAERKSADLSRQFPVATESPSPIEQQVRDDATRVAADRRAYEVRRAVPEVRRLVRLAEMLEAEAGYEALAATYWDAVARRFGGLEDASGTPEAEEVARRVKEAREKLKSLLAKPEVAAAFPAVPRPK